MSAHEKAARREENDFIEGESAKKKKYESRRIAISRTRPIITSSLITHHHPQSLAQLKSQIPLNPP